MVLCNLEGLTQDEAARRLSCSDRTLRRRLTRGHELLRARLARRGLGSPLAGLMLGSDRVPESLIDATARLAGPFASSTAAAGMGPASALILAEGVIEAMTWTKRKWIAGVAGAFITLGGWIGAASGFLVYAADEPAKSSPTTKSEAQAWATTGGRRLGEPGRPIPGAGQEVRRRPEGLSSGHAQGDVRGGTDGGLQALAEPADHSPAFIALAEEFPSDPVAVDALIWVAEQGLRGVYEPDSPGGRAVREGAGDPRS